MEKIELQIVGISYSQSQTNSYALVLSEKNGNRRIPIVIGHNEAQSIALELEKIKPIRPLTHDLFHNFAIAFHIVVTEIIITRFSEGIFYSSIICSNGETSEAIDARTSDAVALALRFGCPLYTTNEILDQAGILLDIEENFEESPFSEDETAEANKEIHELSTDELQIKLQEAIANENYETASIIRDELNKRKK